MKVILFVLRRVSLRDKSAEGVTDALKDAARVMNVFEIVANSVVFVRDSVTVTADEVEMVLVVVTVSDSVTVIIPD